MGFEPLLTGLARGIPTSWSMLSHSSCFVCGRRVRESRVTLRRRLCMHVRADLLSAGVRPWHVCAYACDIWVRKWCVCACRCPYLCRLWRGNLVCVLTRLPLVRLLTGCSSAHRTHSMWSCTVLLTAHWVKVGARLCIATVLYALALSQ